eukprot:TRINITY_DN7277_c0_g1_i1.p1 TRINITY_DN7277_c0_g1~~TRINITY_DN7277_c0_g1_i1.p1  ORF type:complete len:745 (+),score=173.88 TRINITY_DN7277_c0_g1_i1:76-2310(+)
MDSGTAAAPAPAAAAAAAADEVAAGWGPPTEAGRGALEQELERRYGSTAEWLLESAPAELPTAAPDAVALGGRDCAASAPHSPAVWLALWHAAAGRPGAPPEGAADLRRCPVAELVPAVLRLYAYLQCHGLSVAHFAAAVDALGSMRRRAMLLGPVLAAINRRAGPCIRMHEAAERAARAGGPAAPDLHEFPYCQWCHADGTASERPVRLCADCGVAAYCSAEGADCASQDAARHRVWCPVLRLSRLLYCALPLAALRWQSLSRSLPHCVPLPALRCAGRSRPPERWGEAWGEGSPDGEVGESALRLGRWLSTDSLSSPLTAAATVHRLGLNRNSELCILLLGGDCEEGQDWCLPVRWNSKVSRLTVLVAGPHLSEKYTKRLTVPWEAGCPDMREVCVHYIPGLYHEVPAAVRHSERRPDIIFAFNSGIIFYESWKPTLRLIAAEFPDVPFAVTAWMQPEAISVRQLLMDCGWEPVSGCDVAPNTLASLVPQRVTDDHGTCPFNNRYLMVLQQQLGGAPPWQRMLRTAEERLAAGDPAAAASEAEQALAAVQGFYQAAYGFRSPWGEAVDRPEAYVASWLVQVAPSAPRRGDVAAVYGVLGASLAHAGQLSAALAYLRAALLASPAEDGGGGQRAQLDAYEASVARSLGDEAGPKRTLVELQAELERAEGGHCHGHSHAHSHAHNHRHSHSHSNSHSHGHEDGHGGGDQGSGLCNGQNRAAAQAANPGTAAAAGRKRSRSAEEG